MSAQQLIAEINRMLALGPAGYARTKSGGK